MLRKRSIIFLLLALLLSGCAGLAGAQAAPSPTPTEDCGCTLEGPGAQPTGGVLDAPAGPAVGGATATPAPALETLRDRWERYTSPENGISFEYPAAYTNPDYAFCAVRVDSFPPEGAQLSLSLGSRTSLVVSGAAPDLAAAAQAYQSDPAYAGYQFDAPVTRTVAGLDAVSLPYRSGGAGRYSEVTLWVRDGLLYQVETGTPSACDVPAIELTEMGAYSHLLESVQFSK